MPVIAGNYLRRLAGDELGSRAIMPCILLALPDPALPFMAGVPDAEKLTGDRPRWDAPGRDQSHWRSVRAGGLLACGFCV